MTTVGVIKELETVGGDDGRVHGKLTELIGSDARLWPLQPASNIEFIVREGGQNLGVGAHCRQPGEIRAGDAVELAD